jgi:hypothetical protein
VLPPGDFEIWVERRGVLVAAKRTAHLGDGTEVRLLLPALFKD